MVESFILAWKLRKLERAKRRTFASYKKRIQQVIKQRHHEPGERDAPHHARVLEESHDEIETLRYEEHLSIEEIDDEVYQLQNNRIIRLAHRYLIPVPEFREKDGAWEESRQTNKWRLRVEALAELRAAVRKEVKEQREARQSKVVWVTALAGIIGTLTGLVSALHGLMSASK